MAADFTRRALFGATACISVAVALPATAASPRQAWDTAFAEWERAHYIAFVLPGDADTPDADAEAESEAWSRLMLTPAPDMKALHWKLNYLWGGNSGEEFCEQWQTKIVQFLISDAKRLAAS